MLTQQIGYQAADALTALGIQPYTANALTKHIGNVLGWAAWRHGKLAFYFAKRGFENVARIIKR